nr:hypothetical protein [Tanacetum cinerariifolium]
MGENISQEDLNMKFSRSLPYEWNTCVVVLRNKADLDTMSIDDLYNNFKIVEQEVKRTVTTSSSSGSQNMAFLLSPDSTNEVDTTTIQVSTVSTPVLPEHWECRSPRNQESRPRNQDSSKRPVNVEDTSSNAMVEIDGADFYWSYMADDEVPTNMALMAFSDSEVQNSKTCSNTCLKSFETLKTQYDNLRIEFNKSKFEHATYKRGLASVEEQLVFYKKNEVMFYDQIAVLKRDASFRDSEINALKLQIEKLKKEKESNQIKIDNFENASKSLDKLIGNQIFDNSRQGVGFASYNAVAPPPTGLFAPLTVDLSNSSLEEFQHPEFKGYRPKASKSVCVDTSNEIKKASDAPIIKDWVSDSDGDESEVMALKSNNVQHKPEQANQPRKVSQNPRNNKTKWNEMKTQKLGVRF